MIIIRFFFFITGMIIQMSFLATFFWLNVMCFDIWRVIRYVDRLHVTTVKYIFAPRITLITKFLFTPLQSDCEPGTTYGHLIRRLKEIQSLLCVRMGRSLRGHLHQRPPSLPAGSLRRGRCCSPRFRR